MTIAATILLVVMLPITILTATALRELQRVHGPDTMGPAFFFVVAGVLRYLLAAVTLGLLIAAGRFKGLLPAAPLQVVFVYGGFVLIDCAAAFAIQGTAKDDTLGPSIVRHLGQFLGFALPVLTLVLLIVRANVDSPAPAATRTIFLLLVAIAVPTWVVYYAVGKRSEVERQRRIQEYWDEQQRRIAQGQMELAALPDDAPLEKFLPYLVDDWPGEVRGDVMTRLSKRGHVFDELLALIRSDRRDLGLAYLAQMSEDPPPTFENVVRDAVLQQACDWTAREQGGSLSGDEATRLGRQCEQASSLSFKFGDRGYKPVLDAWQEVVNAAPSTPEVESARSQLLFWSGRFERATVTTQTPEPLHPTH